MTEKIVVKNCKKILQDHYGSRFKGLLLYGSPARHQANPESDIDLLVLLAQPVDYFSELRQIIDILYPVQLKSDRLISAKPAPVGDYEAGTIQLYRHAKKEGIMV